MRRTAFWFPSIPGQAKDSASCHRAVSVYWWSHEILPPVTRHRWTNLLLHRRQDLVAEWPGRFAALNRESVDALNAFAGRHPGLDRELLVFATVDVPYGAVRRHLLARRPPPPAVDGLIVTACRAVLSEPAEDRLDGLRGVGQVGKDHFRA